MHSGRPFWRVLLAGRNRLGCKFPGVFCHDYCSHGTHVYGADAREIQRNRLGIPQVKVYFFVRRNIGLLCNRPYSVQRDPYSLGIWVSLYRIWRNMEYEGILDRIWRNIGPNMKEYGSLLHRIWAVCHVWMSHVTYDTSKIYTFTLYIYIYIYTYLYIYIHIYIYIYLYVYVCIYEYLLPPVYSRKIWGIFYKSSSKS